MKNLLLLSFTILFKTTIYAQPVKYETRATDITTFDTFDLRDEVLEGTSYIQNEFLLANIENYDKPVFLKYNAFQDQMEIIRDKIYFIPKKIGLSITFKETNFTYKVFSFEVKNNNNLVFLKVLQDGLRIVLLLQEKIIFVEETKPKTGYKEYEAPRLKRIKDKLFYSKENNIALEMPKNKKDILSIFSNNLLEVKSFVKTNKLNIKNKKDLIKVVEYYNTLR
ncbi:hypothetical protein [Pontimicrobium aquaticum]|uniref:Uncharacterized protein n=1 Tax=Pontimicrobium aquaticum TaxID=2565367 RepID=A0A4U0ESD3_9FLAO|nr:hypothetical protein [Pontimicrobium aquaticum]TJY34696.1 hypothetical protein E5167_10325 [Pontimicrobium aquaticum]